MEMPRNGPVKDRSIADLEDKLEVATKRLEEIDFDFARACNKLSLTQEALEYIEGYKNGDPKGTLDVFYREFVICLKNKAKEALEKIK